MKRRRVTVLVPSINIRSNINYYFYRPLGVVSHGYVKWQLVGYITLVNIWPRFNQLLDRSGCVLRSGPVKRRTATTVASIDFSTFINQQPQFGCRLYDSSDFVEQRAA